MVGTISNVLVMEIGWTDMGSGGYILVSCAHSNTSYFLSSSTINCVNLHSDPEFKVIFTDAVLDFEFITQHPDIKNII